MLMSSGFGDWVVPRWTKRATTRQSTCCQPGATSGPMNVNCFFGVLRTTRSKAAGRGATFASDLVPIDGFEQERFHNDINFELTIWPASRSLTARHPSKKYRRLVE